MDSLTSVSTTALTSISADCLKACQAISSEMELDQLLVKLLKLLLESAGADKGIFLLPHQKTWYIEAFALLGQPVQVKTIALSASDELPQSLIQTVQRTLEPCVIVDVLAADTPLLSDPYVAQQRPQSIFCTPILHQDNLVAILYLEHRVTAGRFTPDRIEQLNILCSQAAIALENARLYENVQHQRQQLLTLLDNFPGMAYSCENDADWTMKFVSKSCFELTGYHSNEILSAAFSYAKIIHPDDVALVDQAVSEAITENQPFHIFYRIQPKQGQEKWVWEQGHAVFDTYGNFSGLEGFISDISDRKAREVKLKAFQDRLQFLIQQTPIGVIEWNENFQVVGWNPAAEQIFGYAAAEMLHQHAVEIVPESDRALVAEVMQALMQQTGGFSSLNANVRKDNQLISCEWINTPLKNADGNAIGIFSMVQDVSDRIAAEQTIRQKSEDLEQALAELQNAQLQTVQSEKMASLGNLVAGVAHEINNPIGFLNGSIKNANDYVKDLIEHIALYQRHYAEPVVQIQDNAEDIDLEFLCQDLPKLLGSMKGATDRIKSISTSLRTFSRADTEHKVKANLHDGLDSTLLILKYRLKANDVRPAIEVTQNYGDLGTIDCFPGQLNQVFMNILANAIDVFDESAQGQSFSALTANPQQITIQTERSQEQVVIRIRDNGKGMDEVTQARIFDHLFTTKGVGKGTGLGLAIARQIIVEKHGGRLAVQSVLGQGTEFSIVLPM